MADARELNNEIELNSQPDIVAENIAEPFRQESRGMEDLGVRIADAVEEGASVALDVVDDVIMGLALPDYKPPERGAQSEQTHEMKTTAEPPAEAAPLIEPIQEVHLEESEPSYEQAPKIDSSTPEREEPVDTRRAEFEAQLLDQSLAKEQQRDQHMEMGL